MIAIRNTLTTQLCATYGDLKDRAVADCDYMNQTELKFGRPAIYAVETGKPTDSGATAKPPSTNLRTDVDA